MGYFGINDEKLDRFGPYGSGLGSVIGNVFSLMVIMFYPIPPIFGPLFAYFLCTCTHRTYRLISKAGLAGAIGSFIGMVLLSGFGYLILIVTFGFGAPIVILLAVFFIFYLPFYMSRYVCQKSREKERFLLTKPIRDYFALYGKYPPAGHLKNIPVGSVPVRQKYRHFGIDGAILFCIATVVPLVITVYSLMEMRYAPFLFMSLVGWILGLFLSRHYGIWFGGIIGLGCGILIGVASFTGFGLFGGRDAAIFSGAFIGGNIGLIVGSSLHGYIIWRDAKRNGTPFRAVSINSNERAQIQSNKYRPIPVGLFVYGIIWSFFLPLGIFSFNVFNPMFGFFMWLSILGWAVGFFFIFLKKLTFGGILGWGFSLMIGALIGITGIRFLTDYTSSFVGVFIGGNIGLFLGGLIQYYYPRNHSVGPN